ncbi:extradiol dioxygenase, partial [Mycobacterium sp. ITM-2017-0098]
MSVKLDLLTPAIEVGLVTTDLDPMVAFYEGFLELEPQGEIEFDGGSQRRYSLGGSVLKLV